MIFTCISLWPEDDSTNMSSFSYLTGGSSTKAYAFVLEVLKESVRDRPGSATAFKLLLPAVNGFILRNDVITRHLLTCRLAAKTADFTSPQEKVSTIDLATEKSIAQVGNARRNALGAISLKEGFQGNDLSLVRCPLVSL